MSLPINFIKNNFIPSNEEQDSLLALTTSEINQTKLNMDLNEYGMNSNLVNNVHLNIAMGLFKLEHDKKLPDLEEY